MKIKTLTLDNKSGKEIELNDSIFAITPRIDIMHRVVEWQRAKRQAGTHSTLERGEVAKTTKKPFRQKGTGNARQGSNAGPHMRGGGVAHGPRVRSHAYSLPKKIKALGLRSALSQKAAEGKLTIIDAATLPAPKTKDLVSKLAGLDLESALFIDGSTPDANFSKAIRNIKHVDVLPGIGANVLDILKHDALVLTVDAVKQLEERLA